MKNSQSKLLPPCPWVPQLLLVTELCMNCLVNSVDKAEIDGLAAFFLLPQSWRRAAAPGPAAVVSLSPSREVLSGAGAFSFVIVQGDTLC